MAYGKTKDLVKRTQSDKISKDKAFKIGSNPNYNGYQRELASMVYEFFGIVNEPNYQLANEFHKPIIIKFKKRKVYSFFRDNIWGIDLADMESLINITTESSIYYVQLICFVNNHGLLLEKIKKKLVLFMGCS